ncbi:histidine phosphatase family protein [Chitiniphilus eburneus]|uniref:Histidine phosphatase family protein n=1 Tax=Chitiniphilus eburneus TaxID=2571148 RepID=A0A4U0P805_9NEIS|nr:histidine phosphatase family protein [Chitiniphilus eburneus]TJZ63657.1 histidine phosphatase family protein [Chitiniphilus eburneus]
MSRPFYLLRHGQTEYNTVRRLQGRCDSPLTELGQAQARNMGEALRHRIGDATGWHLLASPLPRAQHSARLVAEALGLPASTIATDERVIEVGFGDWETCLRTDLVAANPALDAAPDWHFQAPNGETLDQVLARIGDFLADSRLPEKLIVVSHGLYGRLLRGVYTGLDRAGILSGEMPQDAFFHLSGGRIERIDCAMAESAS